MDFLAIYAAVITTVAFLWGVYTFVDKKKEKRRDEYEKSVLDSIQKVESSYKGDLMNALNKGQDMVDVVNSKIDREIKHCTQQFESIGDRFDKVEKRVYVLEQQQMTESKVDSKLNPIKQEVDDTKTAVRDLRDEFRNHASLAEMNTQQLLAGMSEIKGYLKAKSEVKD